MALRRSWADHISAKSEADALILTGKRIDGVGLDLLDEGYRKAKTERGGEPLYVHFSRLSSTREVALDAVHYGAFYGEVTDYSVSEVAEEPGQDHENLPFLRIVLRQPNSLVLQEIAALQAFLALLEPSRNYDGMRDDLSSISELTQLYETILGNLSVLADRTKNWRSQLASEIAVRKRLYLPLETGWSWSSVAQERVEHAQASFRLLRDLIDRGLIVDTSYTAAEIFMTSPQSELRSVVSTILNAFPPLLEWNDSELYQHPGADLIFGIRPLIYHMIREDLLAGNEIRICRYKSCGKSFRADRRDQTCCTDLCSERVRSQKYYETKRKPERQARGAANKQQSTGRKG